MRGRSLLSLGMLVSPLAIACGRTPVATGPTLFVQVVDEVGDGVPRADVELRENDGERERLIEHARTDSDGIATFDFPGTGDYELRAQTDPICCLQQGDLAATVTGWDELLVVETVTGPCPTAVPTWCE